MKLGEGQWKLISLSIGIALLVAGSFVFPAPWSLRIIVERQWKHWPLMLFLTWFAVDGCYWLYWSMMNPQALELMRAANFPASLSLYGICGVLWYYHGSLQEFADSAKNLLNHFSDSAH